MASFHAAEYVFKLGKRLSSCMHKPNPQELLQLLEQQAKQINIVPLTQKEEGKFQLSIERFLKRYTQTEKTAS